MTAPLVPLDALDGYTVTRAGHVYTLTPTKGTAMPHEIDLDDAVFLAERYGEDLIFAPEPPTDPRDVEWWNPTSPDFEREYASEECDDETDDPYFAMGVRTMRDEQVAREAAHDAASEDCHSRAEWRES